MGGHALEHGGRSIAVAHAIRNLHQAVDGHGGIFGVGAEYRRISHAIADGGGVGVLGSGLVLVSPDLGAESDYNSSGFLAENQRGVGLCSGLRGCRCR